MQSQPAGFRFSPAGLAARWLIRRLYDGVGTIWADVALPWCSSTLFVIRTDAVTRFAGEATWRLAPLPLLARVFPYLNWHVIRHVHQCCAAILQGRPQAVLACGTTTLVGGLLNNRLPCAPGGRLPAGKHLVPFTAEAQRVLVEAFEETLLPGFGPVEVTAYRYVYALAAGR